MPLMKLNTSPVTSVRPPQSSIAARSRSVRDAAPGRSLSRPPGESVSRAAARRSPAPISSRNSLVMPAAPPKPLFPPPPPPRAARRRAADRCRCSPARAPAVSPSSSPPMYGLSTAGHGSTSAMYQPAEDHHRTERGEQLHGGRVRRRVGPATRYQPERRHHEQCLPHLGEESEADRRARARPATTSRRARSSRRRPAPPRRRRRRAARSAGRPGCRSGTSAPPPG